MQAVQTNSKQIGTWLSGFVTGCGLTYLMDPNRGNRRRAQIRNKVVRADHIARTAADKAVRDLEHRTIGLVAELRSALQSNHCPDDVLVQRVRARLGRACSHPNSVEVDATDGHIVLKGLILASEADLLLEEIQAVRGVRSVEDRLERHKTAEGISGLQGGSGRRYGQQANILQSQWAPATRLLVGTGAAAILMRGIRRGGIIGVPEALIGAGLLTRAATNLDTRRLLGLGETRSAVRIQKTVNVHARVEEVFKLWAHPENFARFMPHVKQVRQTKDRQYQWTVAGPAGISLSWDAEITEMVPNRLLAWKTRPGSTIRNAGVVRFDVINDNSTRLHILISYNPPGGAIGHVLASLFGSDPKAALDDDLARMKSLLEIGKTRAHGEQVTRDQIPA